MSSPTQGLPPVAGKEVRKWQVIKGIPATIARVKLLLTSRSPPKRVTPVCMPPTTAAGDLDVRKPIGPPLNIDATSSAPAKGSVARTLHVTFDLDERPASVETPSESRLASVEDMHLVSPVHGDLGVIILEAPLAIDPSGGFTTMSIGRLQSNSGSLRVVVKELSKGGLTDTGKEDIFWQKATACEHVLPFLGYCVFRNERRFLVSRYQANGDLAKCLKTNRLCGPADVAKYLEQVLRGMAFLHDVAKLVHGDFKADNILITDELNAVISDFGLSRNVERLPGDPITEPGVRTLATRPYLSLEHHNHRIPPLHGSLPLDEYIPSVVEPSDYLSKTTENDIWAVGTLIAHMYSRQIPWRSLARVDFEGLRDALAAGRRQPFPASDTLARERGLDFHLWRLAQDCWEHLPSHRPSAATLLQHVVAPSRKVGGTDPIAESDSVLQVADISDEIVLEWPTTAYMEEPVIDSAFRFATAEGVEQRLVYWVPVEVKPRHALPVVMTRRDIQCQLDPDGWSKELLSELMTWTRVRHDNLLPLLGACCVEGVWRAVSPMWPSARFFKQQEESHEQRLGQIRPSRNANLLRVLWDIATVLEFLHSQRPPIVHGAVNIENVSIGNRDSQMVLSPADELTIDACLGNFRCMRSLTVEAQDTDPEVKQDVYDFGVMFREYLTGRYLFPGDVQEVDRLPPAKDSPDVAKLYDMCTREEWDARPEMYTVARTLRDFIRRAQNGRL